MDYLKNKSSYLIDEYPSYWGWTEFGTVIFGIILIILAVLILKHKNSLDSYANGVVALFFIFAILAFIRFGFFVFFVMRNKTTQKLTWEVTSYFTMWLVSSVFFGLIVSIVGKIMAKKSINTDIESFMNAFISLWAIGFIWYPLLYLLWDIFDSASKW